MRRSLLAVMCTLALAGAGGHARAAAYAISTIDIPNGLRDSNGSSFTPTSINNYGQVLELNIFSSYLYSAGTFTPLMTGVGYEYIAQGINNKGQITGYIFNGTSFIGFVDTNGSRVNLPSPPPFSNNFFSNGFLASGINDSGQVVGSGEFISSSVRGGGISGFSAFLYSGGSFADLQVSDPSFGPGISDAGEIVGVTYDQRAFAISPDGVLTYLNLPSTAAGFVANGAFYTLGISASGLIVGSAYFGDFIDDNGVFTVIDLPGAPTAINDAGDIVGTYLDASGTEHAYLATPVAVPEPASATLLAMGLAGLSLAARRRTRAQGGAGARA